MFGIFTGDININDDANKYIGDDKYWLGRQKSTSYCWDANKCKLNKYDGDFVYSRQFECETYGQPLKTGSMLTMIVDLNKKRIKYEIDGKKCGVAHQNVEPQKYRVGVTMYNKGDVIAVI